MTPWEIKAREFVNCNCDYCCPCQFNALLTKGNCEAIAGIQIDEGHYGDVDLSGLRIATIFYWPGAVHEGNGKYQAVVDERADEKQRGALLNIMSAKTIARILSTTTLVSSRSFEPTMTTSISTDFKPSLREA